MAAGEAQLDAAARAAAIRQQLEREIARLEAEIAELTRLAKWQEQLVKAARTDPQGALRQRRTIADCLKTPLKPFCDRLTGMYRETNQ